MSNVKPYNCDTLPSQVLVREMKHESTLEINSLLLDSSKQLKYQGRENLPQLLVGWQKSKIVYLL